MVRRAHNATQKLLAALACCVLLSAATGCIGGAQPVPPALDPDLARDASAAVDAGSGLYSDAGPFQASDAGAPMPPPDDSRAAFDSDTASAAAGEATGIDWRWRVFAKPPWLGDAGAPDVADAGPRGESDAH